MVTRHLLVYLTMPEWSNVYRWFVKFVGKFPKEGRRTDVNARGLRTSSPRASFPATRFLCQSPNRSRARVLIHEGATVEALTRPAVGCANRARKRAT
jgi:hypothetical protein